MQKDQVSAESKRETFNTALKIGAVVLGYYYLNKIVESVTGPGERVDRVPFNYNNTQVRKFFVPGGSPEWVVKPDPWKPDVLANELYQVMEGIAGEFGGTPSGYGSGNPREEAWLKVDQLGLDRARALHNYWLDKIDSEDTLYRWIEGEIPAPFSSEDYQKERTLKNLMNWGIGF